MAGHGIRGHSKYFDLRDEARKLGKKSLWTLNNVMMNPKCSSASRIAAAIHILDRGWGKALQSVESRQELTVVIRRVLDNEPGPVIDQKSLPTLPPAKGIFD